MSTFDLEIIEPADKHPHGFNVLVRFTNPENGVVVEYRTRGTIRHAAIDAGKILRRLNVSPPSRY